MRSAYGAELLEMAMELDPEVQDEGPEEGDGADRALASDEAAVSGELSIFSAGRSWFNACSTSPRRRGVGRTWGEGCFGIPEEVPRAGEAHRLDRKRPSSGRRRPLTYPGCVTFDLRWAPSSHAVRRSDGQPTADLLARQAIGLGPRTASRRKGWG